MTLMAAKITSNVPTTENPAVASDLDFLFFFLGFLTRGVLFRFVFRGHDAIGLSDQDCGLRLARKSASRPPVRMGL